MLPPGCARLVTKPVATGSGARIMTMGMVEVAPFAAAIVTLTPATMTSTLRRTRSFLKRSYYSRCMGSWPMKSRRFNDSPKLLSHPTD
jgi:hypothetical protein